MAAAEDEEGEPGVQFCGRDSPDDGADPSRDEHRADVCGRGVAIVGENLKVGTNRHQNDAANPASNKQPTRVISVPHLCKTQFVWAEKGFGGKARRTPSPACN